MISETIIQKYVENLKAEGIIVDTSHVRYLLDQVNPIIINKAKTILLPIIGKEGLLMGLNTSDGSLFSFNFERTSSATYLGENKKLQKVETNIPRIDYFQYQKGVPHILIEREKTNLIDKWLENSGASIKETDISCLGMYKYKRIHKPSTSTTGSLGIYCNSDENSISATFAVKKDLSDNFHLAIHNASGSGASFSQFKSQFELATVAREYNNFSLKISPDQEEDIIEVETGRFASIPPYLLFYAGRWNTAIESSEYIGRVQIEYGKATSYIPEDIVDKTRKTDHLSVDILRNSDLYISSTKKNYFLPNKQGRINIDEYLENEGILYLAIFSEGVLNYSDIIKLSETEFENGRPPVSTDDGAIKSVSITTSKSLKAESASIQSVSVSQSEAQENEVPSISFVSISTSRVEGRIYGGFL